VIARLRQELALQRYLLGYEAGPILCAGLALGWLGWRALRRAVGRRA